MAHKDSDVISPTAQKAAPKVVRLYNQGKTDPRYMKNLTGEGSGKPTNEGVNLPQKRIAQAFTLADLLRKSGK